MPCVCSNTTLRVFIRNVTQLDLPIVAKPFSSTHLFRRQLPALNYAHASRSYSTPVAPQYRDRLDESSNVSRAEDIGSKSRLQDMNKGEAFVDFSPDAIDALAAEAKSEAESERAAVESSKAEILDSRQSQEQSTYDTPLRSLQKDMPRRREREPRVRGDQGQGLIIKRGWQRTGGFKLHYSASPDWQQIESRGERLSLKKERAAAAGPVEKAGAERATDEWQPAPKEPWMIAKEKAKEKYPDGWNPLKRLSPDAMAGIRALHAQMPEQYTPWVLAEEFQVSQEAIQRILKTKWRPNADEQTDREKRWHKRGERIWSRLADLGHKPPVEWRELGIGAGKPDWMKARENPRPRAPLPALITTARRKESQKKSIRVGGESLADQII